MNLSRMSFNKYGKSNRSCQNCFSSVQGEAPAVIVFAITSDHEILRKLDDLRSTRARGDLNRENYLCRYQWGKPGVWKFGHLPQTGVVLDCDAIS
jgi:hypothetical protein